MPRAKPDRGQEQIHGFNFQKLIRAQHGLDTKPNHNDLWDMEINEKAYSMKMCVTSKPGLGGLPLSSLLAFYKIDRPFTMIVGWHTEYRIHTIAEFEVSLDVLDQIRGNVPFEFVEQTYLGLNIRDWPLGSHEEARAWAQNQVEILKNQFDCLLTWNRKIDSDSQRRWQCSLSATNLKKCFPGLLKTTLGSVYRGFDYFPIHMKKDQGLIDDLQERFLCEQKIAA